MITGLARCLKCDNTKVEKYLSNDQLICLS